jgi:hypothetical protein
MKKPMLLIVVALLVVGIAGSAQATRFDAFEATADCDGWSVSGLAKVGSANSPYVNIEYTVALSQNGDVLEEQTGLLRVAYQADADEFSVSGSFQDIPSGNVEISGHFFLPFTSSGDSVKTFAFELNCGQTVAAKRPHYWHNHPEMWPFESVVIGGVTYTKDDARQMMRGCYRHSVIKRLFRHTLAAKLNAANGVPGQTDQMIAAADAFLASHDFHARMPRAERREARGLKNELREFNRGDSGKSAFEEEDKDGFDDYADEVSWSDVKALYR